MYNNIMDIQIPNGEKAADIPEQACHDIPWFREE